MPVLTAMVGMHVITITTTIDEWCRLQTNDVSQHWQMLADITTVLGGVNQDNLTKVCALMQAESGVMDAFIADNVEMTAALRHVMEGSESLVFV